MSTVDPVKAPIADTVPAPVKIVALPYKPAYLSKLNILGALTALLSFLTLMYGSSIIQSDPQLAGYFGLAIGVITVVLRTFGTNSTVHPADAPPTPPAKDTLFTS